MNAGNIRLVGTSAEGTEFYQIGGEVFRVGKGWVPDAHGVPMGLRWECSRSHFDRHRESVYSWVRLEELTQKGE